MFQQLITGIVSMLVMFSLDGNKKNNFNSQHELSNMFVLSLAIYLTAGMSLAATTCCVVDTSNTFTFKLINSNAF